MKFWLDNIKKWVTDDYKKVLEKYGFRFIPTTNESFIADGDVWEKVSATCVEEMLEIEVGTLEELLDISEACQCGIRINTGSITILDDYE